MGPLEFFPLLRKGPRGSGVGNAGGKIPHDSGRGMPNAMRPNPDEGGNARGLNPTPPQDNGTPDSRHRPLQAISPVPSIKKPYGWHTIPFLQPEIGHILRSIVLAQAPNRRPRPRTRSGSGTNSSSRPRH